MVAESLKGESRGLKPELGSLPAPAPPTCWFTLGEGRLRGRNVIRPAPPPATFCPGHLYLRKFQAPVNYTSI